MQRWWRELWLTTDVALHARSSQHLGKRLTQYTLTAARHEHLPAASHLRHGLAAAREVRGQQAPARRLQVAHATVQQQAAARAAPGHQAHQRPAWGEAEEPCWHVA